MNQIFRQQLTEYVNNNDIVFVAKCSTSWHLLAIEAFLRSIFEHDYEHDNEMKIYGVFYVCARDTNGYVIDETKIRLPHYIDFSVFYAESINVGEKFSQSLDVLFARKNKWYGHKKIYIISPESPWDLFTYTLEKSKYDPVSVVIEDGFAHYNPEWIWISETKSLKSKIITFGQFLMIRLIRRKFSNQVKYFELFDKKNGMCVNYDVVKWYKKCLIANQFSNESIKYDDSEVLLLTQPLVDDKHIETVDMIMIYKGLKDHYSDRLKIRIHPRDTFTQKLDFLKDNIIPNDELNVEQYYGCQKTRIRKVIGFNTTSLITLKLFFDADSVSLINVIDRSKFDGYLVHSFKNFEKLFGEFISMPIKLE